MRKLLAVKISIITSMLLLVVACGGGKDEVPANALTATPPNLQWLNATKGQSAGVKPVKITNTSDVEITGISYELTKKQDSIFIVGSDCTATLPPQGTCNVGVDFVPDKDTALFSDTYVFTYTSKDGLSSAAIKLSGSTVNTGGIDTGISNLKIQGANKTSDNNFTLTKELESEVGVASKEEAVTFKYLGNKPVTVRISDAEDSARFAVRNECKDLLTNNTSCNIFFSHTPALANNSTANFVITAVVDGTTAETINLLVNGKGTIPLVAPDLELTVADNKTTFTDTNLGELAAENKILTLKNKSADKIYFRAVTTSGSFDVANGTCTGVLDAGKDCTLNAKFAPSKIGLDSAYVRVIAGTKAVFAELMGTGKASPLPNTPTNITVTPAKVVFPETLIASQSVTKRIVIAATENTEFSVTSSVPADKSQIFRTTTSCVIGTNLLKGQKCSIDVTYAPAEAADLKTDLTINFTDNTTVANNKTLTVPLTGTVLEKSTDNNETPIPDVTVSTKRHTFPDTALGFKSSSFVLTLTNNGENPVAGIKSTSTNLTVFSIVSDATTCLPTVPLEPKATCNIAYQFAARNTQPQIGYLSIWADGVDGNNQIIELKGKGAAFNKYLNFGFVDKAEPAKVISMAYVNDTTAAQEIDKITITSYEATWNVAGDDASTDKFVEDRFVQTPIADAEKIPFTLVSTDCTVAGGVKKLESQQTCLIRLQFDPAKAAEKTHYFARVSLKRNDKVLTSKKIGDDKFRLVGQFHATASTANKSIMFFPPDSDIEEAKMDFSNQAHIDAVTAVIGEKYYIYGGLTSEVVGKTNDDAWNKDPNVAKLRVYDAARNMWKTLNPYGNSPLSDQTYIAHAVPAVTVVDSKLYLFGGTLRKHGDSSTATNDIYVYDPADVAKSGDGAWSKLKVEGNKVPTIRQGAAAASVNGHLFIFGGLSDGGKVRNDFYVIDLRNPDKVQWGRIHEDQSDATTYPRPRSNAAVTTFNGKIYIHGGDVGNNVTGDKRAEGNDLWEYTPKFNAEGVLDFTTNNWKEIYKGEAGKQPDPGADEARPSVRVKHTMSVVDGKLIIAGQGFSWKDQAVADYKKPYFQVIGTEPSTVSAKIFAPLGLNPEDMTKLGRVQTSGGTTGQIGVRIAAETVDNQNKKIGEAIAGHYSSAIEGVFWFFNVKIMGILMDKR